MPLSPHALAEFRHQWVPALRADAGTGTALVCCDWLEESGEDAERVEFVRVQCAVADWDATKFYKPSLPDAGWDAKRCDTLTALSGTFHEMKLYDLRHREHALLAAHGLAWSDSIMATGVAPACFRDGPCTFGYGDVRWTFRRGFVDEVRMSAGMWLAHGDEIAAACPVRDVWLTGQVEPSYTFGVTYSGIRFHLPREAG